MTTRTRRARATAVIEVIRFVWWTGFSILFVWGVLTDNLTAMIVGGFALIEQELRDIAIKVDSIEARQRWR